MTDGREQTTEGKSRDRLNLILGYGEISEREALVARLLEGSFSAPSDKAAWLRSVKRHFGSEEALGLQRSALQNPVFRRQITEPSVVAELMPDLSSVSALLSRPLPKKSLQTARALLDDWVSSLLPELRRHLGAASPQAGKRLDAFKTLRRNLRHYQPQSRRLAVSHLYFHKKPTALPPRVVILLDRSGSMGDCAVWTALCACALYGLAGHNARLFSFAEGLTELTELCDDPVTLLLSLPAAGETNAAAALSALNPRLDAPSRTALFLVSDLRSDIVPMTNEAARLIGGGVDFRFVLPADPAAYDHEAAKALKSIGAKPTAGLVPML